MGELGWGKGAGAGLWGRKDTGKERKDSGGRSQESRKVSCSLSGILNQSLTLSEKRGRQRNYARSAPPVGPVQREYSSPRVHVRGGRFCHRDLTGEEMEAWKLIQGHIARMGKGRLQSCAEGTHSPPTEPCQGFGPSTGAQPLSNQSGCYRFHVHVTWLQRDHTAQEKTPDSCHLCNAPCTLHPPAPPPTEHRSGLSK